MNPTQTNSNPKTTAQLDQELQQLLADVNRATSKIDTFHQSIRDNTELIEAESRAADHTIAQLCSELDQIEIDTEAELDTLMMQFVEDLETNP